MPGMMGVDRMQKGPSGIVDVNGQKVQIKNGKAQFNGQTFMVDNRGQVTHQQKQPVGRIQQGKFLPDQPQQPQQGPPGMPVQ